jgi:hypothetical protein
MGVHCPTLVDIADQVFHEFIGGSREELELPQSLVRCQHGVKLV